MDFQTLFGRSKDKAPKTPPVAQEYKPKVQEFFIVQDNAYARERGVSSPLTTEVRVVGRKSYEESYVFHPLLQYTLLADLLGIDLSTPASKVDYYSFDNLGEIPTPYKINLEGLKSEATK